MPIGLTDYNSKSLADIGSGGIKKIKERLDFDDTRRKVTEFVKNDDRFNVTKESFDHNRDNSRESYREKMAYYQSNIRSYLVSQGIETVIEEDGVRRIISPEEVSERLAAMFVGFSVLEGAMNDPEITDIYCMSHNKIFVEKDGTNVRWPINFQNEKEYRDFVDKLLRVNGKQLDQGTSAISDFEVYGNRGNAIHSCLNEDGYALTLRKHNEIPISLEMMIDHSKSGSLITWDIADMIGLLIKGETNIIIAGSTGSGKTTTMRALLDYYVPAYNKRTLVIEDTPELFLKNPHTLALHTKKTDDKSTSVTLYDLIITALRLKPKYIVVGEVRGAEAEAAVEAMATGHSTIFSMHAGKPIDTVNRLVTKYLMQMPSLGTDVVERIIGAAVNFIIVQDDIRGIGRRITSISEIGYDYEKKRVTITPVVSFNFKTKDWSWHNTLSEEVKDTMLRRGVSTEELDALEDKMKRYIARDKEEGLVMADRR